MIVWGPVFMRIVSFSVSVGPWLRRCWPCDVCESAQRHTPGSPPEPRPRSPSTNQEYHKGYGHSGEATGQHGSGNGPITAFVVFKTSIAALGVMEGYTGYLVRDDYAGWYQFDAQLAGVGQCAAHLIRHAKGVLELHPTQQQWAAQVITVLREAATAVTEATTNGRDHLDPQLLADLRKRYDQAVGWGITTNRHRDWPKGNHPGYNIAKRLHDKADQVWTFTRNLAVPWTNNASEQALKGPKRHQAVSGYWHTLTTLAGYCRVRSYLVSAHNHSVRPIDAIHTALTGNPWLPTIETA